MPGSGAVGGPAEWVAGYALVLMRIGTVWSVSGMPLGRNSPLAARWMMAAAVALLLRPRWPVVKLGGPAEAQAVSFAVMIAGEMAYGLVLGLAVGMLFDVLQVAAHVIGLQAGYGYASTIDPASEADSGVLLVAAQAMGWLLFAACGLDREIVRALARSLEAHPPGSAWVGDAVAPQLIAFGQTMLETAARLALPIAGLLVLIDLALSALGRLQAQLQMLSMTFPVKMLLALGMLAALLPVFGRVWRQLGGRTVEIVSGIAG